MPRGLLCCWQRRRLGGRLRSHWDREADFCMPAGPLDLWAAEEVEEGHSRGGALELGGEGLECGGGLGSEVPHVCGGASKAPS